MVEIVSSLLASLSLALKQPLAGYCDVETTHGDALVTTGTGGQILVTARSEPPARRGIHRYRSASGGWYAMAAMQNVGVALEAARGWLVYDWRAAYDEAFAAPASSTASPEAGWFPKP